MVIDPQNFTVIQIDKGIGIPRVVELLAAVNADLAKLWNTGNPALTDPIQAIEYAGHNGWDGGTMLLNKSIRYLTLKACDDVSRACLAVISRQAVSFGLERKWGANTSYQVLTKR
jgi:hypothetical protein